MLNDYFSSYTDIPECLVQFHVQILMRKTHIYLSFYRPFRTDFYRFFTVNCTHVHIIGLQLYQVYSFTCAYNRFHMCTHVHINICFTE